jgi:hypothetical protein
MATTGATPAPEPQLAYLPLPSAADAEAAHQFLSELRTRIAVQPVAYQYGVEARALESLWELFGLARAAMKDNPGCARFAAAATDLLNTAVRPVTAKWHRAHAEGRLAARDGADAFREDLTRVQVTLRQFASALQVMAYGKEYPDRLVGPAISKQEIDECFLPVRFGFRERTDHADDIRDAEAREVSERRKRAGVLTAEGEDALGLALSGGGIRSATFCLGVVQVLSERGLLGGVDFLSTVSGGGYTGSFLTSWLGRPAARYQDVAGPRGPDPAAIQHLRSRARFLATSGLKESWSNVTATMAGLLLNWTVPAALLAVLALISYGAETLIPLSRIWPWALGGAGAATAIALCGYAFLMGRGQKASLYGGSALALALALTATVGIGWSVDRGYFLLPGWISTHWAASGGVAALLAAGPAIIRFVPVLSSPKVRKAILKALLLACALVVPLIALTLYYALRYLASLSGVSVAGLVLPGWALLAVVLVALAVLSLGLLNVNLTSPIRLYRNGLSRTFVEREDGQTGPQPLTEVNGSGLAPYHLINATLNLPNSQNRSLRERRSTFFLFSKHWCGSLVSGYYPTSAWLMNRDQPDLATAMAISGAAVAPHMGLASLPTLTALMTFLNVRLGFWMLNPALGQPRRRRSKTLRPGFMRLLREMTATGLSEQHAWFLLSDGGHIENLGGYELLRRRCKFVICVDGEADPDYGFGGLLTLVRHAQIDLGIRIEPRLDELQPDARGHCQRHAVLCRIHYPANNGAQPEIGLLLYLKLSMTGNESELIKRYRARHPDFPHQGTLDQFFDQEQFEAYRQLGVHIAEGLFSTALMNGQQPQNIPDWFRRLASNLLEPEAV